VVGSVGLRVYHQQAMRVIAVALTMLVAGGAMSCFSRVPDQRYQQRTAEIVDGSLDPS